VQLAKDRFQGGVTPEIDFRQAEAEYRRIETIVLDLERLVRVKENELSVLLGRNPGDVIRGLGIDDQKLPATVPVGLPSTLLDRRPDIREAEQTLAAATANIGAAKALLFPRFALTGSYGVASTDFDDLFEESSKSWNVLGNVLQPIFEGGRNLRRVDISESQQRQALYGYERTVLQAFRETEDALVTYRKTADQVRSQADRVRAERKVLELANCAIAAVLPTTSRCSTRSARSSTPRSRKPRRWGSPRVAGLLYKALGGGWPQRRKADGRRAMGAPCYQPRQLSRY